MTKGKIVKVHIKGIGNRYLHIYKRKKEGLVANIVKKPWELSKKTER